ncbi:MAG: amylo-alpha-1,6-glucosidase [Alphaproteobacteria bacterium]|nr:amylo-alpha-1,6-glucosidase [Alphaproteobacteria bacterium]
MPFKVQVGPPQIAIHQGQTVLVTDPNGEIGQPSDKGLYFFDTRVIGNWNIYANGESWELLNGGPTTYYAARIFLTNRAFLTEDGAVPPRTLGLVLGRAIGGGMHEDIDVSNYGPRKVRFQLEIALRSDFADIFEVKSNRIVRRGRITTEWSDERQTLVTTYRHADFCRAVRITTPPEAPPGVYANGRISFEVALEPAASWHCCLLYELIDGERSFPAPPHCVEDAAASQHAETLADWQRNVMKIRTGNEEFYRLCHQAIDDMAALRLPIGDSDHMVFLPAAGLPWFVAPFGRDSLIVSLQNQIIYPDFAKATLEILGALQADAVDDYRDAEPGKILHELRYGELAHFKLIPHTPYYGTADATPLYLITLHATWRCTGERALLEQRLATAERCLTWIDEYGDRDGDGFQEYQTRSPVGYENMGWKDSGDAVVYRDGTLVKGPKALCELQGYVYDAWLRMAEIYDALDRPEDATKLRQKAAALRQRFDAAFWDEEAGCYAFALDGAKRQVLSIASNAGHCLWSGIVPPERAARVVARFMQPDMFSGWGIRTLSARHPSFNPYNYQTGSVWPHDNGIIALGFKRYGFDREAALIARDVSRAAGHFLLNQLPELYAGIQRDGASFPVQYLGANVPQAWAAGAAFMLVQALLGVVPDAPRGRVFVDPALPAWLPDLTVQDLRVGSDVFDIRFWREGEATEFAVQKGPAQAVIRRRMGEAADLLTRDG